MDQIQAELIKARVRQFAVIFINLFFLFAIRRNCLRCGRIRSLYLFIRRAMKEIIVLNRGVSPVPNTYKIFSDILLSRLTPYAEEIIWDH
jgi:hypothetical protein